MWLFAGLVFALIAGRAVWPMRVHFGWKIALCALTLAAAFKFHLLSLFGGPLFFAPELPKGVLLLSAWCYAAAFLLFFLLLISELIQLILRLFRLKTPLAIHNRINFGLLAGAVLLTSWGMVRGTAMPQVREAALAFSSLPKEADGMTIVLLADLHADGITRAERIRAIVEQTNALHPDLIVIAGDFVDGTVARRGAELEPLRALSAKYGVYGVPGNHEYYSGYADWMKFLPTLGIRPLLNENEKLPNGIFLSGVTDAAAKSTGNPPPDLKKALAGIPENTFVILVSHRPGTADEAAKAGVSLQLSGHTHGGMIAGIDRLVARFNGGFVSGLYAVDGLKLYVSNGSGIWNGFPVRIGRNAEITHLRLVRAD